MADYAAENAVAPAGGVITVRTGTASADTVPAGSIVYWRNTGAGTHNVTLTTNNTAGGLAVADQVITMTTGQGKSGRVLGEWGDANQRVAVGIDGTPAEVLYVVLGGA